MKQLKTFTQFVALSTFLFTQAVFAEETEKSVALTERPAEWRINGCRAALNGPDRAVVNTILRGNLCTDVWPLINKPYALAIARRTQDLDWEVRRDAVEDLAALGAITQTTEIVDRLTDVRSDVRYAAIKALGVLGITEQAPEIAKRLIDEDYSVRLAAVEALEVLGAKDQVPEIAGRLMDDYPDTRIAAIKALVALDAKDQAPEIAKQLAEEEDSYLQVAVVEALARLGAKDQASDIAKRLPYEDSDVNIAAIKALGVLKAIDQSPAIAEQLTNEYEGVRIAAIEVLAAFGVKVKEQTDKIAKQLSDEKPDVQIAIIEALAKLGAKDQTAVIAGQLTNRKPDVVFAAIEALQTLGATEYLTEVAKLLLDKNFKVRHAAMNFLEVSEISERIPEYTEWREKWRNSLNYLEWLNYEDPKFRRIAVEELGALGVKKLAPQIAERLTDKYPYVRLAAINALWVLGAREQAPAIAKRLTDVESDVRIAAIKALGALEANEQTPAIAKFLIDSKSKERPIALEVLSALGNNNVDTQAYLLEISLNDVSRRTDMTALVHYLGGGDGRTEAALRWLVKPIDNPDKSDVTTVNQALLAYQYFWSNNHADTPTLRNQMSANIARMVNRADPIGLDSKLLAEVRELLENNYPDNAETLNVALSSQNQIKDLIAIGKGLTGHLLFWVLLIVAYPRYRPIQALFFWNPLVRKFLGLGYIGFLLTWSPRLRRLLLLPFRDLLLADARLAEFDDDAYFRNSQVRTTDKQLQPLLEQLAKLRGQVLLEGDSGLGKTSFIRQHLKHSRRLAVFLPAQRCGKGVLAAIQMKLKGFARDESFLKSLIYSGALDVYIDGLNEAPPEVRAHISQFAEDFSKGNLLLTSQPMKWDAPALAKTLELQPLDEPSIAAFLLSRRLPNNARLDSDSYMRAVNNFLIASRDEELAQRTRTILSNPLDLAIVSEMLARGEMPDVFNLQQQFFELMALDYTTENSGQAFPLKKFADSVYELRKQDDWMTNLRDIWAMELEYLARHRLMVRRDVEIGNALDKKVETRWFFRHDKIQDFFLSEAFMDSTDRQNEHLGDARFRGVYLYLARRLPLVKALNLRDRLTEYAADHADHTVSDTYIQTLRTRSDWPQRMIE